MSQHPLLSKEQLTKKVRKLLENVLDYIKDHETILILGEGEYDCIKKLLEDALRQCVSDEQRSSLQIEKLLLDKDVNNKVVIRDVIEELKRIDKTNESAQEKIMLLRTYAHQVIMAEDKKFSENQTDSGRNNFEDQPSVNAADRNNINDTIMLNEDQRDLIKDLRNIASEGDSKKASTALDALQNSGQIEKATGLSQKDAEERIKEEDATKLPSATIRNIVLSYVWHNIRIDLIRQANDDVQKFCKNPQYDDLFTIALTRLFLQQKPAPGVATFCKEFMQLYSAAFTSESDYYSCADLYATGTKQNHDRNEQSIPSLD